MRLEEIVKSEGVKSDEENKGGSSVKEEEIVQQEKSSLNHVDDNETKASSVSGESLFRKENSRVGQLGEPPETSRS